MKRLIIDLNDVGIRHTIVNDGKIQSLGGSSSGVAWKRGKDLVFGDEAEFARAHAPREVCDRFWERLDTMPIEFGNYGCNHAELAAAQIRHLYNSDRDVHDAVCVVPIQYDETQRGILAAINNDIGIPLRYIVPRPLSYGTSSNIAPRISIDLSLNMLQVACLEGESSVSITEKVVRRELGYTTVVRRLLKGIASEFVDLHRIDPFHSVESEAVIRRSVPELLTQLAADPTGHVSIAMDDRQNSPKIDIDRSMLVSWSVPILTRIHREVQEMAKRCTDCSEIIVGHEADCIPGLKKFLAQELDLPIRSSGKDSVAVGLGGDWPPPAIDNRCLFLSQRPRNRSADEDD